MIAETDQMKMQKIVKIWIADLCMFDAHLAVAFQKLGNAMAMQIVRMVGMSSRIVPQGKNMVA